MSRRHRAEKREVIPDPKFGDLIIWKEMIGKARAEKRVAK